MINSRRRARRRVPMMPIARIERGLQSVFKFAGIYQSYLQNDSARRVLFSMCFQVKSNHDAKRIRPVPHRVHCILAMFLLAVSAAAGMVHTDWSPIFKGVDYT